MNDRMTLAELLLRSKAVRTLEVADDLIEHKGVLVGNRFETNPRQLVYIEPRSRNDMVQLVRSRRGPLNCDCGSNTAAYDLRSLDQKGRKSCESYNHHCTYCHTRHICTADKCWDSRLQQVQRNEKRRIDRKT